jgi:hypothetical protein
MEKYSVMGWNNETYGRLVLQTVMTDNGRVNSPIKTIVIPTQMIDELIENLKKHSSSEGDGKQFVLQIDI